MQQWTVEQFKDNPSTTFLGRPVSQRGSVDFGGISGFLGRIFGRTTKTEQPYQYGKRGPRVGWTVSNYPTAGRLPVSGRATTPLPAAMRAPQRTPRSGSLLQRIEQVLLDSGVRKARRTIDAVPGTLPVSETPFSSGMGSLKYILGKLEADRRLTIGTANTRPDEKGVS